MTRGTSESIFSWPGLVGAPEWPAAASGASGALQGPERQLCSTVRLPAVTAPSVVDPCGSRTLLGRGSARALSTPS